jgi:signal transduction histidine kinase
MIEAGDDNAMLGYAVSQLLEPDAFIAKVQALYQSDVESTDIIHFKDGRVFERFTSPLVLNENLVGRIWSFRDATERERARRNLSLAVEVTGVLVWELDLVSRLFRYDFSMLEKLGIEKGEAPESFEAWCERVHPDDQALFGQRVAAALEPGDQVFDLEYRFASRAGQYQWLHSKGRVIQRGADGVPLLAVGTTTNVQSRKTAEAELARLNADLELRVARRTAELEDVNSELNSFSYTIAHDMRAPVRAINGFSEIVLKNNEGKLDAASVGHLKRVVAGSRHMGALIDDLLNLARLSRQEMRRQTFSLSEMAERVTSALATAQPERAVTVVIRPQMNADADPGLVRAVLDNLIGNAWKFTGRTPEPEIEIGAREEGGSTAYFVRDNGAGFDMRYAHKLFSPFQRLHHTEEFEGTGIGLATVKKIVQRHGGRVWVESAVGGGTTVSFTLGPAPAR